MEKSNGSICTSTMADTYKSTDNACNSDGWKRANRKYISNRRDMVKSRMLKFTGRFAGLSGFIYDLGLNLI